jgi:hypothetical protein
MEIITLRKELKEHLEKLQSLEAGWYDGNGQKIDSSIIETAEYLLKLFQTRNILEPDIGPTEAGTILFQWWSGNILAVLDILGDSFELDFIEDTTVNTHLFNLSETTNLLNQLQFFSI